MIYERICTLLDCWEITPGIERVTFAAAAIEASRQGYRVPWSEIPAWFERWQSEDGDSSSLAFLPKR